MEFRLHSLRVLVSDGGPHGEPVPHSAIGLTTVGVGSVVRGVGVSVVTDPTTATSE